MLYENGLVKKSSNMCSIYRIIQVFYMKYVVGCLKAVRFERHNISFCRKQCFLEITVFSIARYIENNRNTDVQRYTLNFYKKV